MTDATTPSRFSPRTLRWALVASLALNVLIIGAVAGSLCFSPHGPGGPGGKGGSPLLGFARTLPRERGDMIRQMAADAQGNLETLRKAERDAREAARTVLSTEPFDQAKFKAALDAAMQADSKIKSARMAVFAETAGKLTPEERHALHEWLDKRRPIN